MLVILSECLKKQTEFAVIKSARHAASFHMHLVFTCFATAKEKKKTANHLWYCSLYSFIFSTNKTKQLEPV